MSLDRIWLKSGVVGLLLGATTSLAQTPTSGCTIDTWTATSTSNGPTARVGHTAVWTSSEMIVWGGSPDDGNSVFNAGAKYNPLTDSWTAISTLNAPAARYYHTAVWTGSEMIIWGGSNGLLGTDLNTGAKYNPSTDAWTAISTANAPSGRSLHTAVWTGSELIVWGGDGPASYAGGRYNPSTDSWTATSTANAPSGRSSHTAVWTGREMIVWGGYNGFGNPLDTGGKYNPVTDGWTATAIANDPGRRAEHTAVWTGSKMIVWGGWSGQSFLNSGREYDPEMDSWIAMSTTNAPVSRYKQAAVWTGNEMIVWGGSAGTSGLNTGGRYNPATGSWSTTSTVNVPAGRFGHTSVWTGAEMIVWSGRQDSPNGLLNTGGRYCASPSITPSPTPALTPTPTPASSPTPGCTGDTWTGTSSAPTIRSGHTAVWTGTEMIVWGGYFYDISNHYLNTGWRYHPATNTWTVISMTSAPTIRSGHTAVWTGNEMIVWGGYFYDNSNHYLSTGGRYNPGTDSWTPTSTTGAPTGRSGHGAIWTGSEMIVWGGGSNTGGRYDPSTDSWTPTNTINAPTGGKGVWTGNEIIVWDVNSGRRYNPSTDSWIAISATNAPVQPNYTLVWTGSEMIAWGGGDGTNYFNTGASYNLVSNSWRATSVTDAPTGRWLHTALWTGREMIVWGGVTNCHTNNCETDTGGKYDPVSDSWTATSLTNAPFRRASHTAVWTENEMIVWGGSVFTTYLNTGGRYCATPPTIPTPTPAPVVNISGNISDCSNSVPGPVPNVTLTLTGSASGSTQSDASGNYQFLALPSGRTYSVNPSKSALTPGATGINTVDVVATQRHYLNVALVPPGCRLTAADVNGDSNVTTVDVIAIQRFFLGLSTGIASVGKYQFSPVNRTYSGIVGDLTSQNYDTLVFGDVAVPFAEP